MLLFHIFLGINNSICIIVLNDAYTILYVSDNGFQEI